LIRFLTLVSTLFVVVFSSGLRAAEQQPDAFVVKEIEVYGLQRMELGDFFNLLPLKVGERLEPARIPTIIRTVAASNNFDDVRLFRDGDKLMIDLAERPTISDIDIDGNSDIETEQILDAMRKSGFAKGEIFDPSAIKNIKLGIEEQYFSHGKYSVRIEDKLLKQSRNRVKVKFNINEGEPARIQRISIVGNTLFEEEELLEQFELRVGGWLAVFSSDDQYSREKLSGDLETLRSYYLDRGYLTYENVSTQVSISPDLKGMYITINIDEGEKFKVNDIVFAGELILNKDQLKAIMPLTKGDIYSAAAITFAEERIKETLGLYGYAFANVVTVPKLDEASQKVDLTLYLEPGKKVYVNRVQFAGNEMTNDEVLRREVRMMEGGALSSLGVDRSKVRLQRLNFLEEVEAETPKVEGKEDRVDVNYTVKERPAGTLSGGVGYNDTFGASLNANISHSNFLGSGRTIELAANQNRFSDNINANYFDPYFTIDGVSAGTTIYYRKSDYGRINLSTITLDSVGMDVNFGYPINEVTRLNFGVGYSDNLLGSGRGDSQQIINFFDSQNLDIRTTNEFEYELFRLSGSIMRNTLNRGIFPDRGTSQTFSISTTVPGSDLEFYKAEYNIDHYIPIGSGWTFLSKLKLSYGDGYGDDDKLPYFENFSAGGSGTMRGFEGNTIGPRLIQRVPSFGQGPGGIDPMGTNLSIPLPPEYDTVYVLPRSSGGNARVLASLELIFPLPFTENSNSVRTSAFVDVGNLWDTKFDRNMYSDLSQSEFDKIPDYSLKDNYRVSAGFSLQWLSPMGPLIISFSRPIRKDDLDETESFSFNVGRTF